MQYIKIFIILLFIVGCRYSPGMNKSPSKWGFSSPKKLSHNLFAQNSIDVQKISYKNIN